MSTTHAQDQQDERATSSVVVDRVRDRIDELLEPRTTSETSWVRQHAGPCPPAPAAPLRDYAALLRIVRPPVHGGEPACSLCGFALLDGVGQRLAPVPLVVEHPPLLVQLHDAIVGSTAGTSSSSGYESRPTLNVEALDAFAAIEQGARFWVESITDAPATMPVEQMLEFLADRTPTLDREDLRFVDQDVLRWWARARVATTWDTAPLKPHVPCMNCNRRGDLRVRTDPLSAVCLHCGAAWDSSNIGILGEHIRIALDAAPELRRELWQAHRTEAEA